MNLSFPCRPFFKVVCKFHIEEVYKKITPVAVATEVILNFGVDLISIKDSADPRKISVLFSISKVGIL